MKRLAILALCALPSCASLEPTLTTSQQGMLTKVQKLTALESAQLERDCDLEDVAACYFFRGKLPTNLPRLAVLQGPAPADRALFTVLHGSSAPKLRYYLHDVEAKNLRPVPVARLITRPSSAWRLEQVEIYGLDPQKHYELLLGDDSGHLHDLRAFRTLSAAPGPFRFAVVRGTDDRLAADSADRWRELHAKKPQLILGLGDLTDTLHRAGQPVEKPDLDAIWERYAETRQALATFREPELTPWVAVWDDLDYGVENGGANNPIVDSAREIQESFFPVLADARTVVEGPGNSKAVKVAGQSFVLLDGRSFRESEARPPGCAQRASEYCRKARFVRDEDNTHFGRVQDDWALSLVASGAGTSWLLSGDEWFGAEDPEPSFAGNHPDSFRNFREKLGAVVSRAKRGFPLAFVSGTLGRTRVRAVNPLPGSHYTTNEIVVGAGDEGSGPGFTLVTTTPVRTGLGVRVETVGGAQQSSLTRNLVLAPTPAKGRRR